MADSDNIIGAFSEDQATRLSGVTGSQLRRWHRVGFFTPSYAMEDSRAPFSRIYSFKDIVALRVLNQLRNVYQISMPELRKAATKLSELGDDVWTATTLYVHQRKVVFDEPETKRRREITSEQYVADIPLKVAVSSAREAVAELNRRDALEESSISRTRYVNRQSVVITGTRIPVSAIQSFANSGYTVDQIRGEYPTLTTDDIKAALAFQDTVAAA